MTRLARRYHLAVHWLLAACAPRVVDTIYDLAYEDGANELREWMRRELTLMHATAVADRMRAYNQGYRDAMRFYGDDSADEAPSERVM